jgi:hypothetical protein
VPHTAQTLVLDEADLRSRIRSHPLIDSTFNLTAGDPPTPTPIAGRKFKDFNFHSLCSERILPVRIDKPNICQNQLMKNFEWFLMALIAIAVLATIYFAFYF